jgi:hypothetical protein
LDVCVADVDLNAAAELILSISDWGPYDYPYDEEFLNADKPRNDACYNLVLSFKRRAFFVVIRVWRTSICHLNPQSDTYIEDQVALETDINGEPSVVSLRYPTLDQMLSALFEWRSECHYGLHRSDLAIDIGYLIRYNMRTVLQPNYAEEFIAELYRRKFMEWVLQQKAHPKGSVYFKKEGDTIYSFQRFKFEGPAGYFVDRNGDPEAPNAVHELVGQDTLLVRPR